MAVFRAFFHGTMSGYEITCLKSFLDHGHDVVVYSYDAADVDPLFQREDADRIIPRRRFYLDKIENKDKATPASFSDIFRYTLLEVFDDWWIDTDVLCLSRDWPEVSGQLVAGWERDDSINCAVLKLGSDAAALLKKAAIDAGRPTVWGQLGPALVTRYVADAAAEPILLPQDKFYAVPITQWDWFYSERLCRKVEDLTRGSLAVHLWNEHRRRNLHDKNLPPPPQSFFGRAVEKHGTGGYFGGRVSQTDVSERLRAYVVADHRGAPIRTQSLSAPGYGLPLVSFVVVNYNYGRFLRQCVESILHQEYSDIECIVVDNASTDESLSILEELMATYPSVRVLKKPRNDGQSAACRDGFKLANGAYVVFTDADDYYLPIFAATHIRVHLTTAIGMGFTSGDMLQTVNDQVVSGTCFEPRNHADSGATSAELLRDTTHLGDAPKLFGLQSTRYAAPIKVIHRDTIDWVWAPTSGNLYRSDAIRLLIGNDALEVLRFATDAYLNFAVNALTGSVLIDKPLAVYRIHSLNNFTLRPGMSGIIGFRKGSDEGGLASALALEHIARNIRAFFEQATDAVSLTRAMKVLLIKSTGQKWQLLERALLMLVSRYFGFVAARGRKRWLAKLAKGRQARQ